MDITSKILKHLETNSKENTLILCFIYAGISMILFVISLIIIIKKGNVIDFNTLIESDATVITSQIVFNIAWGFGVFSLFGMIVSLLAGLELQKIPKTIKNDEIEERIPEGNMDSDMLLPEEIKVVKTLEENNGSMTQNELVYATGFSKVKIHRIIKKLELKKIISKYDYGMTNKIKLEKRLGNE